MEEKNPFDGIKTYDNYTHLWQLTLFILFMQVLSMLAVLAAGHLFKIKLEIFEGMIPVLLVTAYVSSEVLDGLGVSRREAWQSWTAGAKGDLVKAFKYFWGYAALLGFMAAVLSAVYCLFAGGSFEKLMKPVADSGAAFELAAQTAAASPLRVLFVLFSACVAAPVAEELFFRRIVYASLRKRKGFWASAFISGLLFSLFHGASAPVILPVGMYLAWVYERERRLPVNIMLHGMVNFCITLFRIFG